MKISLITAFPELMRGYLDSSVLGRGIASGKLQVEVLDLRDYAEGAYRQIDDFSFGGGGMVLMAEPLARALEAASGSSEPYVLYPSPQGVVLHQELVEDIVRHEHVVIVCGHYEGVDERFVSRHVSLEISMGDFVLTGGELPALALVDALARLVPGVVGKTEAVQEDSFYSGMLDNAHYTRPAQWRGQDVPGVLTSGHEGKILLYRRRDAALRTLKRRPDLLGRAGIGRYLSHGIYIAWLCRAFKKEDTLNLARMGGAFGIRKTFLVSPREDVREKIKECTFVSAGETASYPIKTCACLEEAAAWIGKKEKNPPLCIAVPGKAEKGAIHWLPLKRRLLAEDRPPLFIFGEEAAAHAECILQPIWGHNEMGDLPLLSAVSITLDRFLGWR